MIDIPVAERRSRAAATHVTDYVASLPLDPKTQWMLGDGRAGPGIAWLCRLDSRPYQHMSEQFTIGTEASSRHWVNDEQWVMYVVHVKLPAAQRRALQRNSQRLLKRRDAFVSAIRVSPVIQRECDHARRKEDGANSQAALHQLPPFAPFNPHPELSDERETEDLDGAEVLTNLVWVPMATTVPRSPPSTL